MPTAPPPVLQFPALLHGTYMSVARKAKKEGRHCARHYRQHGTYPLPSPLREVQPGEVVMLHSVADFFHDKPAWRLYFFLNLIGDHDKAMEPCDWEQVDATFEHFCRATPWGALFHVIEPSAPKSAERMASRLGAVLHFWDCLSVPRYQHKTFNVFYTLEELITNIYGRTMNAWCAETWLSVREHLGATVDRMTGATREECLQTVQRLIPQILAAPSKLKHREALGDPAFQHERLSALPPDQFKRLSSAYPSAVYEQLRHWDDELDLQ